MNSRALRLAGPVILAATALAVLVGGLAQKSSTLRAHGLAYLGMVAGGGHVDHALGNGLVGDGVGDARGDDVLGERGPAHVGGADDEHLEGPEHDVRLVGR